MPEALVSCRHIIPPQGFGTGRVHILCGLGQLLKVFGFARVAYQLFFFAVVVVAGFGVLWGHTRPPWVIFLIWSVSWLRQIAFGLAHFLRYRLIAALWAFPAVPCRIHIYGFRLHPSGFWAAHRWPCRGLAPVYLLFQRVR